MECASAYENFGSTHVWAARYPCLPGRLQAILKRLSACTVCPQVESNYGNPAYVCLYRIRMHGIPVHELGDEA